MRRLWPQVLELISQSSKTIWAMLEGSQVVASGEGTITLSVAPSLAKRLGDERNVGVIANAVTSLIGGTWRVDVQPASAKPAPAAPRVDADPRDEVEYEAAPAAPPAPAADAEAEAMRLLRDELGARPVEG
jgi:DNA polymerase-3 subunit gamma/tau